MNLKTSLLQVGAAIGRTRDRLKPRHSPLGRPARVPAGQRIYAIGDVHGRLDLFDALVGAIERDDAARGEAKTTVVLLGDLIDRGPDSAGVLDAVQAWAARREVRVLCGNHEEMFLRSFHELEVFRAFLQFGGWETVMSYPVDRAAFRSAELPKAQRLMAEAVPARHLEFLAGFEDRVVIGDYAFVHAGIRPGSSLEDQRVRDLRWIREPFLSHDGDHGYVIVHGHTISDEVEIGRSRIGIDTGAYRTGRLTALALEDDRRWLIRTEEEQGAISAMFRSL